MMSIIAHHYVVNSGITEHYDMGNITANMIFLQIWGMWGKTAINAFVMITGYFMCTSQLTWKRFFKIYAEAKFYNIVIFIVFLVCGYEVLSLKSIFKVLFGYLYGINNGFTASFLAFYLFIPFYNILIKNLNKKQLLTLGGALVTMFTITSTFFFNGDVFHEVAWYMTLYFIAAYIRLYPNRLTENNRYASRVLLGTVFLAVLSILVIDFVGSKIGFGSYYYYMVANSNKLFALIIGVGAFICFKNFKLNYKPLINKVASTTFGVLLIHANSDAMRTFLWSDLLRVPDMYTASIGMLVLHAVLCMAGIFSICSLIDFIRICVIEKPLFRWIDNNQEKIEGTVKSLLTNTNIKRYGN